jgi:hypothetical protein
MVGIHVGKYLWCRFHCTHKLDIGLTKKVVRHFKDSMDNADHRTYYKASVSEVPSYFHICHRMLSRVAIQRE